MIFVYLLKGLVFWGVEKTKKKAGDIVVWCFEQ